MWTHPLGFLFLYNSFGVSCGRHEVTISRETLASTAILNLQGTGATFPLDIYTNANFAYRFTAEDILVRYQGIGSSGGKCNIQGYWATSNSPSSYGNNASLVAVDNAICSNTCTMSLCGFDSTVTPKPDRLSRVPLVDYVGSDSLLSEADYTVFSDLQMYPAVAGACVTVYNIPELHSNGTLGIILSRAAIAKIFSGSIHLWSDPLILASNTDPYIRSVLEGITQPIKVITRFDGSGTTEIFTTTLSSFDPVRADQYDSSFARQISPGEKPSWCGKSTDELQFITITNCTDTDDNTVNMMIVGRDYRVYPLQFRCNDTASTLADQFRTAMGGNSVYLDRAVIGTGAVRYTLGYLNSTDNNLNKPTNWYEPVLISKGAFMEVLVTTKQEGGFLNSHYSLSSTKLTEVQSIWIDTSYSQRNGGVNLLFTVSCCGGGVGTSSNVTISSPINATSSTNLATSLAAALASSAIPVASVSRSTYTNSPWVEYKVTFVYQASLNPAPISITITSSAYSISTNDIPVIGTTLSGMNNAPLFQTSNVDGSKSFTCYKREHSYVPWTYRTANGNSGVSGAVFSVPYSISYSVVYEAIKSGLQQTRLINRSGNIVSASSESINYAVMELGSILNSRFNAILVDGNSKGAWPMTGYSYFILRTRTHIGSCEQRRAVASYLYDFYNSEAVKRIAEQFAFSVLPDVVKTKVVQKLIDSVMCNDQTTFALSQYRLVATHLVSPSLLLDTLQLYNFIFKSVESRVSMDIQSLPTSMEVWESYKNSYKTTSAAFTLFSSGTVKMQQFASVPEAASSAFAHIPMVFIYHLNVISSSQPLTLTPGILADILLGRITKWNDEKIRAVNSDLVSLLPASIIKLSVRQDACDDNILLSRYLARESSDFKVYYQVPDEGRSQLEWSKYLSSSSLADFSSNNFHVDNFVNYVDGSLGYYTMYGAPQSKISYFCRTGTNCTNPINPSVSSSLESCVSDTKARVSSKSSPRVNTYDLMLSDNPTCYPLVFTVDFSFFTGSDATTCSIMALSNASTNTNSILGLTDSRVRFSSWLFASDLQAIPLTTRSITPSSTQDRLHTFNDVCSIQCHGVPLGYKYCNYRNCSFAGGDYLTEVSECNNVTRRQQFTYNLKEGSTCFFGDSPLDLPLETERICQVYVYVPDTALTVFFVLSILGIVHSMSYVVWLYRNRNTQMVVSSTPVIMSIIIICCALGQFAVIISVLEEKQLVACGSSDVIVSISFSLLLSSILVKARRVNVIFGGKFKVQVITLAQILTQAFLFTLSDVIVHLVWRLVDPPRLDRMTIDQGTGYTYKCTSSLEVWSYLMLGPKALLLLAGLQIAFNMRNVHSMFNEAQSIAFIIFNMAFCASIGSLAGAFAAENTFVWIFSHGCIIIVCNITVAVMFIPKLMHVSSGDTVGTLGHSSNSNKEVRVMSKTTTKITPSTDRHPTNPNHPESSSTGYVKMLQDKVVSLETELLKREQHAKLSQLQDTSRVDTSEVTSPDSTRSKSIYTAEALAKLKERRIDKENKRELGSPTFENRD